MHDCLIRVVTGLSGLMTALLEYINVIKGIVQIPDRASRYLFKCNS